ncbi:MAG: hypothetical protein GWP47_08500 [Actinobacteria bacterium]|nr:hypothetical protein [Actinomycetota bacterium]
MYGIALSAASCIRAGTRVDIAWIVDRHDGNPFDPSETIAITPGGGRLGSLLNGALDGHLIELAGTQGDQGRLVRLDISPVDAAVSGTEPGSGIGCMLVPGTALPEELWEMLLSREPVCLIAELDGDTVIQWGLHTSESVADAGDTPLQVFEQGSSAADLSPHTATTVLQPRSTLVVGGGGEIADSLERIATMLGWQTSITREAGIASGLIAALSPIDSVVVIGHDLELTGKALLDALSSDAGYIGAVGPRHLQETRADWLAYRGMTDLARLRGPAGIDIGARTPQEIALSITAEIVAAQIASPTASR